MALEWRRYCGGLVLGGFEGGRARVGIAGPHPNTLYSVSFYDRPMAARRDLFVRNPERGQRKAERILAIWDRAGATRREPGLGDDGAPADQVSGATAPATP